MTSWLTTTAPAPLNGTAHTCTATVTLTDLARAAGHPVGRAADICRWLNIDPADVVNDWRGEASVPATLARDVVEQVKARNAARLADKAARNHAVEVARAEEEKQRYDAATAVAMKAAHEASRFTPRWDLVAAVAGWRAYYGHQQ